MLVEKFVKFVALSGLGWLCDLSVFVTLLRALDTPPWAANLVSSYVGLTFVYFTSVQFVFRKRDKRSGLFLLAYWMYQVISILAYSAFIGWLSSEMEDLHLVALSMNEAALGAKVIVTPMNLCTNFLFLKLLSGFMEESVGNWSLRSRGGGIGIK